jgi:hypothetical protein
MKNILYLAALLCLILFFLGITGCTSVATERIGESTIDLRYNKYETVDDTGIKGIARIWNYNGQGANNVTLGVVFFDRHGMPVGDPVCNIGDMFPGQSYPFTISYPKSKLLNDGSMNDHTMVYVVIDNTSYVMNPSILPLPADQTV